MPRDEIDRRVRARGRDARHRRAAGAQAARAVGRAAAACGARARARARAAGVPDGRAAVEPRREAPGPDAQRDQAPAAAGGHDDRLRDARPDRGDDDGRPRRGHAATACSSRSADTRTIYERPGQRVRGGVHRQPVDELRHARRDARRWPLELRKGELSLSLEAGPLPGAARRGDGRYPSRAHAPVAVRRRTRRAGRGPSVVRRDARTRDADRGRYRRRGALHRLGGRRRSRSPRATRCGSVSSPDASTCSTRRRPRRSRSSEPSVAHTPRAGVHTCRCHDASAGHWRPRGRQAA